MFEGFNLWDKILELLGLKKKTVKEKKIKRITVEKAVKEKKPVAEERKEAERARIGRIEEKKTVKVWEKKKALKFEIEKVEKKKKPGTEEKKEMEKKTMPERKKERLAKRKAKKRKPLMFEVEKIKKEKKQEERKKKREERIKKTGEKAKAVKKKKRKEVKKEEKKIPKKAEFKEKKEKIEEFKTWPGIAIKGPASLRIAVREAGEKQTIDEKIEETRSLMKNLERQFFKRRITQEEFRKKMMEYRQRVYLLRLKKKKETGEKVKPEIAKKGFERISKAPLQGIEEPVKMQPVAVSIPEKKTVQAAGQTPEAQQGTILPKGIEQAIKEKDGGIENEQRLQEVEKKLKRVIEKYNIPASEVEKEIQGIHKGSVIEGIDKVIHLIELEQRTHRLMQEQLARQREESTVKIIKPEFGTGFESGVPKKKEIEVKKIVKEVEKHKIVTEFDKLLELVRSNGRIKINEAMNQLGVGKEKILECCEVLADSGLVELEFPPFGQAVIKIPGFVMVKKQSEKKEKRKVI